MRSSFLLCLGSLFLTTLFPSQASSPEEMESLRTHSLYIPYVDEELRMRYWDFGGNTIINTNKHVRLTTDHPSKYGSLWSKLPLPEKAFQIEFQFAVHGTGSHLYGDGFAFWLTKQRATSGPVFGNQDYFEGIGIFFDTYMNGYVEKYFPYINAMNGDGKTRYDHDMDGKTNELGGCEVDFRGLDRTTKARVTYYEGSLLELEVQYRDDNSWTKCFSLRGVKLPKPAYLGFTAMTGEVTDNHDIVYVSTHEITSKPPVDSMPTNNFGSNYSHSEGMGWFLKLVLFAGICGVAFVGYRMFQTQNNKRF